MSFSHWVENVVSLESEDPEFFCAMFCFLIFSFFWDIHVFMKTLLYSIIKTITLWLFKFPKKINIFTRKNFENPFGYTCVCIIWNEVSNFYVEIFIYIYKITNFIIMWIKKFLWKFEESKCGTLYGKIK